MSSLILNLPYSSCTVPPAVAKALCLSEEELRLEHWRLSDPHLGRLVRSAAGAQADSRPVLGAVRSQRQITHQGEMRPVLAYAYSPLVADPLGLWAGEMGGEGDGAAILLRSTAGRPISWTEKDRAVILGRSVEPYYRQLEDCVEKALENSPLVLVLTLRSFTQPSNSSIPLNHSQFQSGGLLSRSSLSDKQPQPQVRIFADESLTPKGLADLARGIFRAFRWRAEFSRGPGGCAWLPPPLRGRSRVKALGLALDRGLYLDEHSGRAKESLAGARRILATLFNLLEQEVDRVGQIRLARAEDSVREKRPSPVIKAADL